MPDLLEHAPDLAVLAFDQRDLVPGVFSRADQANFRWCSLLALRSSPLGLVHQQIHVTFDAMQQFPIHANVIALEISLGAEFGDDLSIHRNRTAGDKLLRRAAGRDPSSSNDFLQAFRGHVKKRLSDRTI